MPALSLGRRGLTLVEVVVAMVLLGLVSAAIYGVLLSSQRIYHAQAQRIDLQQNVRAAAALLPAELRELNAAEGDVAAITPTSITIRAMRQLAIVCSPPAMGGALNGLSLTVRDTPFFGSREFDPATDSLLVYYEGDEATRADDGWVLGDLTAVPAPQPCPDGSPGRRLIASLSLVPPQTNAAGVIPVGAPVRGFEWITYRVYQASDGKWYLGLDAAGSVQPVAGPLDGANGLRFAYHDASGAVTADPARVAEVEIAIRGVTAQRVRQGSALGSPTDSLFTRVALRNNPRF